MTDALLTNWETIMTVVNMLGLLILGIVKGKK